MFRPNIRNHSFDWMGEVYAPYIDGDHFLGRSALGYPRRRVAANVSEADADYLLELAVPGFTKEDLTITLDGDFLKITGKRESKIDKQEGRYLLNEFGVESFERWFRLAPDVAQEEVAAKLENGILSLRFTKKKSVGGMKERQIQVDSH
jgi:HSP20 family protein